MSLRRSRTRLLPAAGAVLGAALLLSACGSGGGAPSSDIGNALPAGGHTSAAADGRLVVVAGENTWGDIAAQIGGDAVSVTSLINNPNEDPHEYESNVDDAAAVAHARLVIRNGAGYDAFVGKLLSAQRSPERVVLTIADIVHVGGSNPNPHLWYRPAYVVAAARAIAAQLTTLLPQRSAEIADNLRTFLAEEQRVTDVIARIRAAHAGEEVAYTEAVAGYLVDEAGLRLGTPLSFARAMEEGTDPSPLDDALFRRALTDHTVKVLIYNAQVTDSTTRELRALAQSSGIPVVGMTETVPPSAHDFASWQLTQAQALEAALDA